MEKTIRKQPSENIPKKEIWDCGSSLYDSFELKSFEKQLDSAISSRTLSMPHLSDRRTAPPVNKKPASKISRSLQRLIRSVFRPKNNNNSNKYADFRGNKEGFYDGSGSLCAIPEVPEFDGLSPELRSLVRRTTSDRFDSANFGVYCV